MKKFISLILVFLLCFSFSVSAFANSGFVDKPTYEKVYNGDYSKYYDKAKALEPSNYENLNLYQYLDKYSVVYPLSDIETAPSTVIDLVRNLSAEFTLYSHSIVAKSLPLSGVCTVSYDGSAIIQSSSCNHLFVVLRPVKLGDDYLCYRYKGIFYFLLEDGDIFIVTPDCTGGFVSSGVLFFPSSDFKQAIEEHSVYYEPTGSTNKVSWKTDKYFSNSSYDDARSSSYFTFLDKHTFFGISGMQKCYMVPFFDNGEDLYFSNYCLYFELLFDPSGVSDTYDMLFKYVDLHNTVSDLSDPVQYLSEFEKNSYKFSDFSGVEDEGGARTILNGRLYSAFMAPHNLRFFDTFDHFLVYSYLNALSFPFPDEFDPMDKFYNSSNVTLTVSDVFNEINFPACPLSEAPCDWGFIVSDTPILMDGMGADIDTTKIPDNYYITVSGDTIYDYSITNPETGQSSTVNEYITNNYTYITNNNPGGDGGGSGSSGTTGGNVSVGGNVGVNGNVNVGGEVKFGGEVSVGVDVSPIDINVNVSGAGESGNGGGDPPEIGGVDDLVDYLPEKSPAINEYLKIFFDTLPPELLGLILAGVAVAIIKLIFRR